mgnify:CR=1 FL=1
MEKYNPKIQKELVQIYLEKFWPKWRRELFGELYRTFHPSTYEESFSTPTDNFIDMLDILEDKAVHEGVKLGLINPDSFNSFPRLDGELIIDEGANLDWVHGMLLYSVIYDLVMDFRCYEGVNGIDPNCEGKYMNDFNCLKQVYEKLYDYMLKLEEFGVPVGELIGQEKLKKIPLVDLPVEQECSGHKHSWKRIDRETEECRGRGGCGLLRTNALEPGVMWRGTDGINDEENEVADTLYGVDNNQGFDEDDVIQDYQDPNELLQEALEDDPEVKWLLDNIDLVKVMKGPDASLISDYVEGLRQWGRYNMMMTDLSPFLTDPETVLKGELSSEIMQWATENESWPPDYEEFFNQQEDPLPYLWAMRQKIRDAMTRLTMRSMEQTGEPMEMDNVNKVFRELAKRIYVFVLRGPHLKMAQDRKRRLDEADELNPPVQIGDVIELLHLEDPYSPIPLLTKGIVVGFDKDPWENRLLVKWIIDPDVPEFKDMPLYPSIDAYRLVRSEELLEESTIINEQSTQTIDYSSISEPKFYGNKGFVFLKTNDRIRPGVEQVVLVGPTSNHPTISIDSFEARPGKYGGLQVNYNDSTRGDIELVLNKLKNTKPQNNKCDFKWVSNPKYWSKSSWRKKLAKVIQDSLNEIYSKYKAPDGLPTPNHIKNGFINVPDTEAHGTNHGWSILNFFQTNPLVRQILIKEYENFVNNQEGEIQYAVGCKFNIDEFVNWIGVNRQSIFSMNSPTFKEMVRKNQSSWKKGNENEQRAAQELMKLYDGWDVIYGGEPGIFKDALEGSDIRISNKETGESMEIQVKPLEKTSDVYQKDGKWWVKSGWLKQYPLSVTHYLFGPSKDSDEKVVIFKNEGQGPTHTKEGEFMIFNSPPLNPETINESVYKSFWN